MAGNPSIRTAGASDSDEICQIDADASSRFATIPALEDLSCGSHGQLQPRTVQEWIATGCVYVLEEDGLLLGFLAVQKHDSVLYVAELSVVRTEQGRGLGTMLLEKAVEHARNTTAAIAGEHVKVSLTTYPDVPWNGPWYRRRGFREVDPTSLGPWHVEKIRRDVADLERPGYRRSCMLWEDRL